MRSGTLVIYLLLLGFTASAQTLQPVGHWREHLPYNRVLAVEEIGGIIWAATPHALFSVDPGDNTIERVSKISGLTGKDIRTLGTDGSRVIVIYHDGNIDIVDGNGITNIPDISADPQTANKSLNRVYTSGTNTWIAGTEAIYLLDTEKHEVRDTYTIGDNGNKLIINDLNVHQDTLFAATASGLRSAPLNGRNLSDFRNWSLHPDVTGNVQNILTWGDQLLCRIGDSILLRESQGWSVIYVGQHITNVSAQQQLLITEASPGVQQLTILNDVFATPVRIRHQSIRYPLNVINRNEVFWIADSISGLLAISGGSFQNFVPASPVISDGTGLTSNEQRTVFAGGGRTAAGLPLQRPAQLSVLSGGEWISYDATITPALTGVTDLVATAVDPSDGSIWAGSYGSGLLHFIENNNVRVFAANSFIRESLFAPDAYVVSGLAFDNNNVLWITNPGAEQNLIAKKADGTTVGFKAPFPLIENGLHQVVIDQLDQKWLVAPRGNGLIAFSNGGSLENTADDQWKWYRGGSLPSDNVNCLAIDADGFIWIGTDAGIAVIRCVSEVFSGARCEPFRPVVQQDNFAGYLFASENVQAIAVDGANRKWVGTNNGVWLISPDGEKIIYRFTDQNSPLLANDIRSLSIDPKTGEVFIATSGGLSSFRSTATDSKVPNSSLLIFPNPVPPDFSGTIAIRGVPNNAIVKITELNGKLVFQTRALGGQAVWNGRDYRGRKISSGVYLVLISDDNKKELATGKIIYVNR